MGKHHPATLFQPPKPEPGLKLVRFWTPTWDRCISNTLVTHWDHNDWRAAFRLWPSHPLAADWDMRDLNLLITTNEDVPVVWSIDQVERDCCGWLTVRVVSWQHRLHQALAEDWRLLDLDNSVTPPITRYGGDE